MNYKAVGQAQYTTSESKNFYTRSIASCVAICSMGENESIFAHALSADFIASNPELQSVLNKLDNNGGEKKLYYNEEFANTNTMKLVNHLEKKGFEINKGNSEYCIIKNGDLQKGSPDKFVPIPYNRIGSGMEKIDKEVSFDIEISSPSSSKRPTVNKGGSSKKSTIKVRRPSL